MTHEEAVQIATELLEIFECAVSETPAESSQQLQAFQRAEALRLLLVDSARIDALERYAVASLNTEPGEYDEIHIVTVRHYEYDDDVVVYQAIGTPTPRMWGRSHLLGEGASIRAAIDAALSKDPEIAALPSTSCSDSPL